MLKTTRPKRAEILINFFTKGFLLQISCTLFLPFLPLSGLSLVYPFSLIRNGKDGRSFGLRLSPVPSLPSFPVSQYGWGKGRLLDLFVLPFAFFRGTTERTFITNMIAGVKDMVCYEVKQSHTPNIPATCGLLAIIGYVSMCMPLLSSRNMRCNGLLNRNEKDAK